MAEIGSTQIDTEHLSRRAGTSSTPLYTFSLGGAAVPVPFLLHYIPSH